MKAIRCAVPVLFLLALLAGSPAWAHGQTRWMCGVVPISCGHHLQATCQQSTGCHPGFAVWDIPDQCFSCIIGEDCVTHGCYDPQNAPDCSLCSANGQYPCPSGIPCAAGCDPWLTPGIDGKCTPCGSAGQGICNDGDPPCQPWNFPLGPICAACGDTGEVACPGGVCMPGNVDVAGICFGCGGAGEIVCAGGTCDDGYTPQAGICLPCGGDQQAICLDGCHDGTGEIGPHPDFPWSICAYCGGPDGPGGEEGRVACDDGGPPCEPGYYHVTPAAVAALDGSVSECGLSENETYYVERNGICSLGGGPEPMTRAAPETWQAEESHDAGRETIILIHGRGGDCVGGVSRMLDDAGLLDSGHLVYCASYAQVGDPDVDRRTVRLLPVLDDELGNPEPPCTLFADCEYDFDHPVAEVTSATFDVPGVVGALKDAILAAPTEGQITLIPHSQGGFVARELIYSHYDELRWSGKTIRRVITLGHPYYAKQIDPHKYAPWLCSEERNDFDCATGKWTWGWGINAAGLVDNDDYPQIEWTVVSGDGPLGNVAPEDTNGDGETDAADEACSEIFGGIPSSSVAGDSSVPIDSSLGHDEWNFFAVSELHFDRGYHTTCGHNSLCLYLEAKDDAVECGAAGAWPMPVESCWGEDPHGPLLPVSGELAPTRDVLDFDGDDHVALTDPTALAALDMGTTMSLELWMRPEEPGQTGSFLSKEGEYQLALHSPTSGAEPEIAFTLKNSTPGWSWRFSGFSPPQREWTHVALTYDGATIRIYANGIQVYSVAGSGAIGDHHPGQDELWIGGRQLTGPAFAGQIDDVRVWNRALSRIEVIAGAAGMPGGGVPTGLIAWWAFDEGSGDDLVDSAPNGFDITMASLATSERPARKFAGRADRKGGALLFDGVDDRVGIDEPSALSALEMDGTMTLEAWIFPRGDNPSDVGMIVDKEGEYWLARFSDGRIGFAVGYSTPGWVGVPSDYVAPLREWTHVALVFDHPNSLASLFINGQWYQSFTIAGSFTDSNSNDRFEIGAGPFGGAPFHGVIDEVRVWDYARSTEQIAALYDRTIAAPASEPGLLAYWPFDERDSRVAFDVSGNAMSGNLGYLTPSQAPRRTLAPQFPGYALVYGGACGNGFVDPLETCDDGGTASGDGCSAACRMEFVFTLSGSPLGGTLAFDVEGVTIQISTTAGQSLSDVMAALAAAIQADATLAALGVEAVAVGDWLFVTGHYDNVSIDDPGLADCWTFNTVPWITGPIMNSCPETGVTLSTEAYAEYQWYHEGQAIENATQRDYVVTLTGDYRVRVGDGNGCFSNSNDELTFVTFCPESEISPTGAIFPLRVERSTDSPTGYYLYFQKLDDIDGVNFYEGTFGSWYSHGGSPGNECGLEECFTPGDPGCYDDLGTGELRMVLSPEVGDRYFLLSAYAGNDEGPSGLDSDGSERDPAQNTCLP